MTAFPYLAPWLQCLLRLAPPRGLVHVGAGGGSALQYPFASMPRLLAVEAEAAHHVSLQAQLQNYAHCQVVQAVVASQPGIANYYSQSQSNENGLCPPDYLRALWPNIKVVDTEQLPTTTLQTLLGQAPGGATAFNWALIDCLPAGDVVRGAGTLPATWDVVVVRALNDVAIASDPVADTLSLHALTQQLSAFGLEFVAIEEENHPKVVRALYVRNSAQARSEAIQQRQEQATLANALQADLAVLQAQHDRLAQKNEKLKADRADLVRARDELSIQRDAEALAKAEAIQKRQEQATLANELQAHLAALQAQRDSLAQENAKLIADHADMARARDELSIQRDAAARAKTALTTLQQETTSKLQRLQQLEEENQNYASRQHLLQEELIKAEAQIDLIKDLLLREPGL